MKNRFLLIWLSLLFLPSLIFAKTVTVQYPGGSVAGWKVTYQVDNGGVVSIQPPKGMWMTRTGMLSKTITFNNQVKFAAKNPATYITIKSDKAVVTLTKDEKGNPAWGTETQLAVK